MQTSFTDKQLLNKDNKNSETIIRQCVHCGMCNATCPTYGVNGEELEGPRGRIYLIKDMLENKKPATKEITKNHQGYYTLIKIEDDFKASADIFTIDPIKYKISEKIKKSFDPKRIFNPGKMYTGI